MKLKTQKKSVLTRIEKEKTKRNNFLERTLNAKVENERQ